MVIWKTESKILNFKSYKNDEEEQLPKRRHKTKHHATPRISAQRQFAKKKPWFTFFLGGAYLPANIAQTQNKTFVLNFASMRNS